VLLVGQLLAEALHPTGFCIHGAVHFSMRRNWMALMRLRKAEVAGLLCLTGSTGSADLLLNWRLGWMMSRLSGMLLRIIL